MKNYTKTKTDRAWFSHLSRHQNGTGLFLQLQSPHGPSHCWNFSQTLLHRSLHRITSEPEAWSRLWLSACCCIPCTVGLHCRTPEPERSNWLLVRTVPCFRTGVPRDSKPHGRRCHYTLPQPAEQKQYNALSDSRPGFLLQKSWKKFKTFQGLFIQ